MPARKAREVLVVCPWFARSVLWNDINDDSVTCGACIYEYDQLKRENIGSIFLKVDPFEVLVSRGIESCCELSRESFNPKIRFSC